MLSGQSFKTANQNAGAHKHTIDFFHGLQVAITATVMFNIVQYAYWTVLSRRQNVQGHWNKFGPVYILIVASVLVNIQPMMILCIGSWYPSNGLPKPGGGTYATGHDYCVDNPQEWPCNNAFWDVNSTNSFFPSKASGWLIQVFCTYLGYVLLIVGVVQATDMAGKMRRTWRMARG